MAILSKVESLNNADLSRLEARLKALQTDNNPAAPQPATVSTPAVTQTDIVAALLAELKTMEKSAL